MAADCGVELRKHQVACISVWPGGVQTELFKDLVQKDLPEGVVINEMMTSDQASRHSLRSQVMF